MLEQDCEVAFNERVAQDTYLMGLRAWQGASEAAPGRFVMIRVGKEADPLLRRPFSIAGIQGGDILLVLYRVVGRGSARLAQVGSGERLPVLGPLGVGFQAPQAEGTPILVGGGMGVAPLIFLAQRLAGHPFSFLGGFKDASEVPGEKARDLFPQAFRVATEDGSRGYRGLVTDLLREELDKAPGRPSVFACGPRAMLVKVAAQARERGFSCQVSLEAEMACGVGACQGCAVTASDSLGKPYLHVCTDGPVVDAGKVAW